MKKTTALRTILIISAAGLLFSGYLSYNELWLGAAGCPAAGTQIFGLPACVYGFVMYLIVFMIAFIGARAKK